MAAPAPSQFAALLKQSKFATYTPSIAQVYTTHGGYAYRGDWGLKRPLSVRKRNANLLIQAIDTAEQQTEFRSGEPERKMVKRWEETGHDVQTGKDGSWHEHIISRGMNQKSIIDSEFGDYGAFPDPVAGPLRTPACRVKVPPTLESSPNYSRMKKKEFERHLENLRKLRPEFKQLVGDAEKVRRAAERARALDRLGKANEKDEDSKEAEDGIEVEDIELFKLGNQSVANRYTKDFISYTYGKKHGDPNSQTLEPFPHHNGGLMYTRLGHFATSLLYDSFPARVANQNASLYTRPSSFIVTAAGVTTHMPYDTKMSETVAVLDWDRQDLRQGTTHVRFRTAILEEPPEVVSSTRLRPPRGVARARMKVESISVKDMSRKKNPYPPGSIQYSASEAYATGRMSTTPIHDRSQFGVSPNSRQGKVVLNTINQFLRDN